MSETAVALSSVCKSFGDIQAVEDLDLEVPRGSIYGLLGPNGAGKTTTIRIVLDILGADAGSVEVLGRRVDDDVRTRIGYLPEERGLYQKMSARDQIAFLGVLKGMDRKRARREADMWLERIGLADRRNDRLEDFSKGMQQKVQFVSTVVHDPELLVLDEPFSGLDPLNVDLLKEIVLEKNRAGTTVLFSTHQIEDAERLCERVCMIAGARKVLDGRVRDLKAAAGPREVLLEVEGGSAFADGASGGHRVLEHGPYREIRFPVDGDPQDFLRRALASGAVVRRFELVEASLREIFLERARGQGLEREATEEGPRSLAVSPPAAS